MDKLLRIEIINEVKRSLLESMEVENERWIYGEELSKQFQMFSPSWLKATGLCCHARGRKLTTKAEPLAPVGAIRSIK